MRAVLDQLRQRERARIRAAHSHDMGESIYALPEVEQDFRRNIFADRRAADGEPGPRVTQERRYFARAVWHMHWRKHCAYHARGEIDDHELGNVG